MPRSISHYFLTIAKCEMNLSKSDLFQILIDDVQSIVVAEEKHIICNNDPDNYQVHYYK